MSAIEAIRVPLRCSSCGEPLYTRVLVCPLCGAADPLKQADDAAPDERPDDAAPPHDAAVVAVGEAGAAVAPVVVVGDVVLSGALDGEVAPSEAAVADPDAPGGADEDTVVSGEAPPADAAAVDEAARDAAAAAAAGRSARTGMLDIAPDRDGPPAEPGRDLVIVPERGGRDVALYAPRRHRGLAVLSTLAAVVLLAVVGLFAWRMVGPMQAAAPEAQEVTVGRAWQPLDLAPLAAGEEWVLSADGPFRLRVDGVVYTIASPVPFAVPLGGKSVEIRAVSDGVKVAVGRR